MSTSRSKAPAGSKVFVLIEMADVEMLGARCFTSRVEADGVFDAIAQELQLPEFAPTDLACEVDGTLRLAGDDAASVQLLEVEVE